MELIYSVRLRELKKVVWQTLVWVKYKRFHNINTLLNGQLVFFHSFSLSRLAMTVQESDWSVLMMVLKQQ